MIAFSAWPEGIPKGDFCACGWETDGHETTSTQMKGMAVSVYLWSGERRIVADADGAHIHGDFFVVTQGVKEQMTMVLTLWAPSVIYAEVRHENGALRLVRGVADATCGQCADGWICEQHPYQPWPHDDCTGPGLPCENPNCPHRWRTVPRETARRTDLRCRSCRQALVVMESDTPPELVMRCRGCGHRWRATVPGAKANELPDGRHGREDG